MNRRILLSALALAALTAASSAAVTFSNFVYDAATFPTGPSTVSGTNAISWLPTGARAANGASDTVVFSYDVTSTSPLSTITTSTLDSLRGTGAISFTQDIFVDTLLVARGSGSSIGGTLTPLVVNFNSPIESFRVVNTYTLSSTTGASNVATLGLINQNVAPVPEPASLLALGAGAGVLLKRRRRSC